MVANGKVPAQPLAAVQAYVDWRRFGSLPHAGGTFDQPAHLLEGMRVVHAVVAERDEREQKKMAKSLKQPRGRR